mgnify:CR=1 FL=1
MIDYFGLFFDGPDQALTLVAALAVMGILTLLGGALAGRNRPVEIDFVFGWGALTCVFTVVAVFFQASLGIAAWGMVVAAAAGGVVVYKRDGRILAPDVLRVLLLATPLLLIAAAMVPSQWDEFSHWLPASRFLLLTNDVPSLDNPVVGTQMLPAYPFGWPYLTFLASRISGVYLEGASRLLNVMFLLFFGLLALRVAVTAAGDGTPRRTGWKMASLAVLFATLVNPTFIQKIILTAYADIGTSVTLGVTAYLFWALLNAQAANDTVKARQTAWQIGLVGMALINIKQVNLILLAGLALMYLVVAWRDRQIRFSESIGLALAALAPAMLIYAVWRYHVGVNFGGGGAEASFMPFENWNIGKIHLILWQMLFVAGKKIGFFGVMAVAAGFGIRALFNVRGPFDRLAILIGGSFVVYNGFLFFTYVASFGEQQALTVASFWRYNTHLGMLAVLFGAVSAGMLWRRYDMANRAPKAIVWLPLVLIVIAPFIFAKKLRFDLEPNKPHYTAVANALIALVPNDEPLIDIDPQGTGESSVIARYTLNHHAVPYLSVFHGPTLENIRNFANQDGDRVWVLVHSLIPDMGKVFGLPLKEGVSYLLKKQDGTWRVIQEWPYPNNP